MYVVIKKEKNDNYKFILNIFIFSKILFCNHDLNLYKKIFLITLKVQIMK